MNLSTFLSVELQLKPYAQQATEEENPIAYWIHNHTGAIKAAKVALAAIGAHSINKGLSSGSFTYGVPLVLSGALAITAASIGHKVMDIFAPPTHQPNVHMYTTGKCPSAPGVTLGYHGNVPILTVATDNPFHAGYGHGWLLAEQLYVVWERTSFALHNLAGIPRSNALKETLKAVSKFIPNEYLTEIEGLVKGYNDKRNTWFVKGAPLTKEDVILLHLLPDMGHFEFLEKEKWLKRENPAWNGHGFEPMACTVLIDGDQTTGPIFGRNLDWKTLGVYGTATVVMLRQTKAGIRTVELGLPGFIGTLTGMNNSGFSLAMNVCRGETDYITGVPAAFFNRMCLESCQTVEDAKKFVGKVIPLGPYHLSIADSKDAMSMHFYQNQSQHFFREWTILKPLITTNFRYGPLGRTRPTITNSPQREAALAKYYDDLDKFNNTENLHPAEWIEKGLALPHVNNIRTVHHVMMCPKTKTFSVAFDNGWAASQPMTKIPLDNWFIPASS